MTDPKPSPESRELAYLISETFDSTSNHVDWIKPLLDAFAAQSRAEEREACIDAARTARREVRDDWSDYDWNKGVDRAVGAIVRARSRADEPGSGLELSSSGEGKGSTLSDPGSNVTASWFCANCGRQNRREEEYCPECKRQLTKRRT